MNEMGREVSEFVDGEVLREVIRKTLGFVTLKMLLNRVVELVVDVASSRDASRFTDGNLCLERFAIARNPDAKNSE